MPNIDTKELRERYHALTKKGASAIADELDRLYKDTTPLSREELETVLVENGWGHVKENSIGDAFRKPSEERFGVAILLGKMYVKGFTLPFSAVTRQTLRACGVIK